MEKKTVTGADLIIGLFLLVTIPHTAQILIRFEDTSWWWLAWSLAGAIDIGIAYGGVVSGNANADKEARQWATALFVGLSVGSYLLNVAHYIAYGAWLFSVGLGAFFPIGILLLAKIKSRLASVDNEPPNQIDVTAIVENERQKYQILLADKDRELDTLYQNAQNEITKLTDALATKPPEISAPVMPLTNYRDTLIKLGKARLNEAQSVETVDRLLAEWEGESE